MLKRVVYYLGVFVIACVVQSGSHAAVTCPDTTDQVTCTNVTGCVINSTVGCRPCTAGKYYDNTDKSCKSCPSDKPHSAAGSVNGISDCRAAQIACNAAGLTGCSGTIDGNANWDDNAGAYKYGECTCTTDNEDIKDGDNKTIGKGTKTCRFNQDGTEITTDCLITVNSCIKGYCQPDGTNKCAPAPTGHYSNTDTDKTCKECPYGSTTDDTGADAAGLRIHPFGYRRGIDFASFHCPIDSKYLF